MTRKFFGTDGIRGLTNSEPMTAQTALCVGNGGRRAFPARRPPPPRGDRQGHAPVRLHDGIGDGRGLHQRRHGRRPARPDADPGGGDADPIDARRPRGDDLRLAQSVRGQWHQVVRARRLQAQRPSRTGNRKAHREGDQTRQIGRDRPGAADRRRARALHPIRQGYLSRAAAARRAQGRGRLRQRRGLPRRSGGAVGAGRGSGAARGRAQRTQHQRRTAVRRIRNCSRKPWSRVAPTSASRSTATPTG